MTSDVASQDQKKESASERHAKPSRDTASKSDNPSHYPFVFANEEGRAETANYIKYAMTGAEVQHLGTRRKGTTPYACPLHARAFPEPNFYKPGVKDTDLALFYPDCTSRVIVDD